MNPNLVKHHYKILAHLLRGLVAERFKRMAKDEVLFKFISHCIEPAILVDHNLQAEREALDLAEMSLLELVSQERLEAELQKSADRIQNNFQRMFGQGVASNYASKDLISLRVNWLSSRVDFYRRMLSLSHEVESPAELGAKAFRSVKKFSICLDAVSKSDREFSEATVSSTNTLHRFLMKKHMDYDLKNSEALWGEFASEAFRKTPELTE